MNERLNPGLDVQLLQLGVPGRQGGLQMAGADFPAWFIEHGTVDVVLVRTGTHGGTGTTTRLFSVTAGQLLCVPPTCADGSVRLALLPDVGAAYRCIERAQLLDLLERPALRDAALAKLDQLAASIAAGIGARAAPPCQPLAAGRHAAGADQQLALAPGTDGMWFTPLSGQVGYLGQGELGLGCPLPLPPNTWITLRAGSEIEAFPVEDAGPDLSCGALLEGVDALFLHLHRHAIEQAERDDVDELARLHAKRALNEQAMNDALGGLVSLFHERRHGGAQSDGRDSILAACKVIGERLGVDFKPAITTSSVGVVDVAAAIAQASGVRVRKVTLKGDWWLDDNGPLLAFSEEGGAPHALMPTRRGRYLAVDPRTGAEVSVTADFAHSLQPVAYSFYAGLPSHALRLRDIVRFVGRTVRPEATTVLAIGLAGALLGMAIPIASGYLFDSVFPAADRVQMVQVVMMLFIASLVTLLLDATRALTMLRIEGKASNDLMAAVWDRVLSLPVPFFRAYTAGDLATRIDGINEIRRALAGSVILTALNSVFAVLNVFLLFYYSAKLALVAIALLLFAVAVNALIGYASAGVSRQASAADGKVAGLVFEYLSGVAKLRITGSEARAFSNWAASFGRQKGLALRVGKLASLSAVFNAALPLVSNALLFACIGMVAVQSESAHFTTGDFIAFGAAWTIFLNAALSLVKTVIELLPLLSLYERTKPILTSLPEVDASKPHPGVLTGAVELSNVSFSYAPDGPLTIDDVSIAIKPGQFVALVGASGSGKSTLLRLMLGFEQPTHGGLYVDGQNLNEVDIGAVRRQMGVVLQGGRLMSGDIFTNIVGANLLTHDDAWAAAAACGLDRDIKDMPMGIHTLVSDGGTTLSGGQRQRLLIARAIVTKPKIIYFDEATSALDNQSQATVSASLEKLRATRVVIAHRLSTIMKADCIYVLDKGRVVQSGSYEQLMAQGGMFADLAKRQMA